MDVRGTPAGTHSPTHSLSLFNLHDRPSPESVGRSVSPLQQQQQLVVGGGGRKWANWRCSTSGAASDVL